VLHPVALADFRFTGYDLVDIHGTNSAFTNCGGFPDVFANSEISCHGLHPEDRQANCHVWAIFQQENRS